MTKKLYDRFWEIDFLRGIAIIMMIVFHLLFDIDFFGFYQLDLYSGYLLFFLYSIGIIFLLLVGISLSLSYNRVKKIYNKNELFFKFFKRGLKIFLLGLIITFVSWFYLDSGIIIFGVLHCIGLSIILAFPLLKFRFINLFFGFVFIFIGFFLRIFKFDFYWLVWLGFKPAQFYTVDYFPLFPWFGVILIGLFLGNTFYQNYKRKFRLMNLKNFKIIRFFCFLGRNSLLIYFLHQPIIFSIFYLLTY